MYNFNEDGSNLYLIDLPFRAYLEDSDISYEMKEQSLPFAPISFNNDSMMLRVLQKLKLTFNVFADNREQCIKNYESLIKLIEYTKPMYYKVYDQWAPSPLNVVGYFTVKFNGLPLELLVDGELKNQDTVIIHLTSFSYTLNKDVGYINVPYYSDGRYENYSSKDETGSKLIPLAYKISLEGKILQRFTETIRRQDSKTKKPSGGPDTGGLAASSAASAGASTEKPQGGGQGSGTTATTGTSSNSALSAAKLQEAGINLIEMPGPKLQALQAEYQKAILAGEEVTAQRLGDMYRALP